MTSSGGGGGHVGGKPVSRTSTYPSVHYGTDRNSTIGSGDGALHHRQHHCHYKRDSTSIITITPTRMTATSQYSATSNGNNMIIAITTTIIIGTVTIATTTTTNN